MPTGTPEYSNLIDRLMAVWNSHTAEGVNEIYAEEYHGLDVTDRSTIEGTEGVTRQLLHYARAFPDLNFIPEKTVHQNDSIAVYWTARGTHSGTLLNIPPTGCCVTLNGMTLLTVENDKIKQGIHLWDLAALLRAMGLLPDLAPRAPLDLKMMRDALNPPA